MIPHNKSKLLDLALMQWEHGDFDNAGILLRQLIRHEPENLKLKGMLAKLDYTTGNYHQAFSGFSELAQQSLLSENEIIAYLLCAERLELSPSAVLCRIEKLPMILKSYRIRERVAFLYARARDWDAATLWANINEWENEKITENILRGHDIGKNLSSAPNEISVEFINSDSISKLKFFGSDLMNPIYIDLFLTPRAIDNLRKIVHGHKTWRSNPSGSEVVASLSDGFIDPMIFMLNEEIKLCIESAGRKLTSAAIWCYKYYKNDFPVLPHADDGLISVNIWITPNEFCLDFKKGGLKLWKIPVSADYFGESEVKQKEIVEAHVGLKNPNSYVPYRCNRATVFFSKYVHQTQKYLFDETEIGRRISITFLYA